VLCIRPDIPSPHDNTHRGPANMSKRGSIYSQGKPEDPYNEREDAPADPPKQATAAQLAARK